MKIVDDSAELTPERAAYAVAQVKQVYRAMKRPAFVGEVRMKVWRTLLAPVDLKGLGSNTEPGPDAVERQRVLDYWARQRELYGYDFSEVVIMTEFDSEGPIIVSSVKVTAILPGERSGSYGNA